MGRKFRKIYTLGIMSKDDDVDDDEAFVTELKAFLNDIDTNASLLPFLGMSHGEQWSGYYSD
jgi:hypothetical protein